MFGRPVIDPVVWQPPVPPVAARWPTGPTLPALRLLHVNGLGPEDVVVDAKGNLLTGVQDGRILRISPDGRELVEVADTRGRPLGLELLPDGALVVCDAYRGLLRVDPETGAVDVLLDRFEGAPLRFCKSAAVDPAGSIYFTDASRRFGFHDWKADIMEHSGTGRLLRLDPDGAVTVLLDGLQLANGVALSPDRATVVVAETGSFQLTRFWLAGPRAGAREVLAGNLPGYPFGVSLGTDGLLWVAISSPHNRILDQLARRPPLLRRAIWALPEQVHPKPVPVVWVIAVEPASGAIVHDLHGPPHHEFAIVTGVREYAGTVYLGSVVSRAIGAIELRPPASAGPAGPG